MSLFETNQVKKHHLIIILTLKIVTLFFAISRSILTVTVQAHDTTILEFIF